MGEASAFFKSVNGLKVETEVVDYQEGGVGPFKKRLGRTLPTNLVLKRDFRGQIPDDPMQKWFRDVAAGQDLRADVSVLIITCPPAGSQQIARYDFLRCIPAKWELPELDSTQCAPVVETFELSVEGMPPP